MFKTGFEAEEDLNQNTYFPDGIPKSVKDVRAFLGYVNFYRNFAKDLSRVAQPLYNLTKTTARSDGQKPNRLASTE